MSTGQLVFYSGVGLLVFTIVLGIAFWLKKPQYIPGNAAYDQGADKNTQKLRSGYPTDHLTVRREPKQPIMSGTAVLQESTAQLETDQEDTLPDTAVLPNTEFPQAQQTEKLGVGTVHLTDGTIPLAHDEDTVPLYDRATPPDGETEVLDSSIQADRTEKLGATTPLPDLQRK